MWETPSVAYVCCLQKMFLIGPIQFMPQIMGIACKWLILSDDSMQKILPYYFNYLIFAWVDGKLHVSYLHFMQCKLTMADVILIVLHA